VSRNRLEASTRERILTAAMLRFSMHSYDTTTLRDLAADVRVDVAYVHRCFGSKEKLFCEALRATLHAERLFGAHVHDLSRVLAREIVIKRAANEIRPLDIVFRSFSSPDASRVLREVLATDIIARMRDNCPQVSGMRAAMVICFLAGLYVFKDVIGADALVEAEDRNLEQAVIETIESIMSGDQIPNAMYRSVHRHGSESDEC